MRQTRKHAGKYGADCEVCGGPCRVPRWEPVKNHPGIYRRKGRNGKPIYRAVRVAGRDASGRHLQEVRMFNGAKVKDALDEAQKWKDRAPGARHVVSEVAAMTLQEAYDGLHADPKVEYSPATRAWHDSLWAAVPDELKARKLKDVSTQELRERLKSIDAPVMRDRARQLVGTVYRHAGVESPAVKEYAPSTRAKRMRDESAGRLEGRYRTDNEVNSILRFTPERYRALVVLMWRVGLRPGESYALTVGQVNPDTHELTIDRAVNDGQIGPTKTGRIRKPVLPASVFEILSDHIRRYSDWTDPDRLVFTTDDGSMIDADNFRTRVFAEASKAASVNHGVIPMDLRHTAASNLIAAGVDVVTVAVNTGHSVQVLMSTYAHEVQDALRRAADRMDDVIRASAASSGVSES